jgi:hypothetical protein
LRQAQASISLSPEQRDALSRDEAGRQIDHADSFFTWLHEKIPGTADYLNPSTRLAFVDKVNQLIADLLAGDSTLRHRCFVSAEAYSTTCEDAAALALNDMCAEVTLAQALQPGMDESTLVGHGINTFVLGLVTAEAQAKIGRLAAQYARNDPTGRQRNGEDVETMLYFQTKLGEALRAIGITLRLPVQDMLYSFCAGVSEADIDAAANRISAQYHDGHSLIEFLGGWLPLSKYVERTYATQLSEAEEANSRGVEEVVEAMRESGESDDREYVENMNGLIGVRATAREGLRQQLLDELLQRRLPGATFHLSR